MKLVEPEELQFIHVNFIQVSADKVVPIGNCIREAIILAATEWRNVRLIHKDKAYEIKPMELFGSVGEGQVLK